jgi:hypothetical protein
MKSLCRIGHRDGRIRAYTVRSCRTNIFLQGGCWEAVASDETTLARFVGLSQNPNQRRFGASIVCESLHSYREFERTDRQLVMFAPGWCVNRCYGPCRPKSTQSAVSPPGASIHVAYSLASLYTLRQHRTCCPGQVLFWSIIWLVLQNRTPPELC